MGIFSFFRSRPKGSASTAKDRLQVLIAHERTDRDGPDYLPLLKKDIMNVIKKYVDIGEEQVLVQLDSQDDCDVLELNITLPEDGDSTGSNKKGGSRSERTRAKQTRAAQTAARTSKEKTDKQKEPS